jgi:hypothetical protein
MTDRRVPGTVLLLASFAALACEEMPTQPATDGPAFAAVKKTGWRPDEAAALRYVEDINAKLQAQGATYAVQRMEWAMAPGADLAAGNVVFANDRDLRLESRWVPGDARRLADGDNITHATWLPAAFAPGVVGSVDGIVDAAFNTWGKVKCSKLPLVKRTLAANIIPSAILGVGGFVNDPFAADIGTIGWIPGSLFDAVLGPGASQFVLGVTFTFTFVGDANGDGRSDTAHKEIWYNGAFTWSTSGSGIDVESVVLHENGHALELGHFGKIHGTLANLKLHASPRAVMNAIILGTLRQPLGTDNAGYCGNFASWPN